MKIGELIELLQAMDPEKNVIVHLRRADGPGLLVEVRDLREHNGHAQLDIYEEIEELFEDIELQEMEEDQEIEEDAEELRKNIEDEEWSYDEEKALQEVLPLIAAQYLEKKPKETFLDFVNNILEQCANPDELRQFGSSWEKTEAEEDDAD